MSSPHVVARCLCHRNVWKRQASMEQEDSHRAREAREDQKIEEKEWESGMCSDGCCRAKARPTGSGRHAEGWRDLFFVRLGRLVVPHPRAFARDLPRFAGEVTR